MAGRGLGTLKERPYLSHLAVPPSQPIIAGKAAGAVCSGLVRVISVDTSATDAAEMILTQYFIQYFIGVAEQ